MIVQIQPKSGFGGDLTQIDYYSINDSLQSGGSCTLFYTLSGTAEPVCKNLTITGEDYAGWSGDNDALKPIVLRLLNLVEAQPTSEVSSVEPTQTT